MSAHLCKEFLKTQINSFVPFSMTGQLHFEAILNAVDFTLNDTLYCLRSWRDFETLTSIDPLHSRQYATFLILLSRRLYNNSFFRESDTVSYLNKMLNCCEVYGHVALNTSFLIGHTIGIVLGRADYGNHLCIQHNVTVGRWGQDTPKIGERVMLMNGSLVAGNSVIGSNSIVSAGVRVLNQHVPPNSIAFDGPDNTLIIKPS